MATITDVSKLAHSFSFIADGEYNLKNQIKQSNDVVSVLFHAGGYVDFCKDRIFAVIDTERCVVWELLPQDFRSTIDRFCEFLK